MGKIIIPGAHGIGTCGYEPTPDGYKRAADALLSEYKAGRHVDESNPEIQRVLTYYGANSMRDLQIKWRGW